MSMPNIPNINPEINICKNDAISLMYLSIAMQEISLSHILNAEGEMLQQVIGKNECDYCLKDLTTINESVNSIIDKVHLLEKLLVEKVNTIKDIC